MDDQAGIQQTLLMDDQKGRQQTLLREEQVVRFVVQQALSMVK
jgi:hypothetical protein